MNTPLSLQPLTGLPYDVIDARLIHLFTGAWTVDLTVSANSLAQNGGMPSGKVILTFGGTKMSGTIDPRNSGSWGPRGKVRVVGGAGAWDTVVTAQDFHSDALVTSTMVYSATAASIGEVVVDILPQPLGIDFARTSGPASRVFRDNPWWVDFTGVTNVGPRPPALQDLSLVLRDFDPTKNMITFSSGVPLVPNTTIIDPSQRFGIGKTFTVYDVEQVFDANGSTGWAWTTSSACSQLVSDLKSATLEWTRANYLRVYRYRLITYQGPGPGGGPSRMALQAVNPTAGAPDLVPITPTSGLAGCVNQLAPSQEVLIGFEDANPGVPYIVSYALLGKPLQTTVDASVSVHLAPTALSVDVGAQALSVALGGGTEPLTVAPWATALTIALGAFCTACASAVDPHVVNAASALATALGLLPPPATVVVKAS